MSFIVVLFVEAGERSWSSGGESGGGGGDDDNDDDDDDDDLRAAIMAMRATRNV